MGTSAVIAVFVGIWVGVLGAIRRYSLFDYLATIGAMVALSIPTFWFGLVTIYIFSLKLALLPAGNMYTIGNGSFLDYIHHLIAPSLVLGLVTVALWSRYMRSSMLEVINQDYIRTARAKGVGPGQLVTTHALRNSLIPIITVVGLYFGTLIGNSVLTEIIFNRPGLGKLIIGALNARDYTLLQGLMIIFAICVIVVNTLTDLAYGLVDPRVKYT